MSQANETAGFELVESQGKAWSLSHIRPGHRARFSAWCKARARQKLRDGRADMGEDWYREQSAFLEDRIDAEEDFEWLPPQAGREVVGSALREQLRSRRGNAQLLALLLEQKHGLLSHDQVQALVDDAPEEWDRALRAALGLAPLAPAPSQEGETKEEKAPPPEAPAG